MRKFVAFTRLMVVMTLLVIVALNHSPEVVIPALMLAIMLGAVDSIKSPLTECVLRGVDSTSYLADAKIVYGTLQDQISTLAILMNLFGDGSKFAKPINNIGIRGYVFLARLQPNWNMGYRPEGTGGVGAAGNQGLANSTVQLKYAYVPVTITGQAENLTKGESKAFMQAKALETKFDMKDITSHVNVVVAGAERGGQLAQVAAGGTLGVGTFDASNVGNLPAAIYLRIGMPIDMAPVGGGAFTVQNATIAAINYGTRAVTHTGGLAVAGNAVALSGEYPSAAGAFPYTSEGLVSLISDTTAIQGLNPATPGQQSWASFLKDTGAATLSSQLVHEQKAFTKNRGGVDPDMYLFPTAQVNQLVGIATTTLRFDVNAHADESVGKKALDLGFTTYEYAGLPIIEDKDLRPDRIYCGASEMMKKFEAVPLSLAEDEAGTWTRMSGANGIADAVMGLLRWYHQIGIVQRSAWSVYKNYTVPTSFLTAPPTL
jgi:hypothetical protein